jgi:transcriptional regulator with XRE-family HTH domain
VGNPSEHRKTLAQALRHYRKQAGFTQEKLGELAELNPKYIGEVERCEKTISVDALARIAAALRIGLEAFFQPPKETSKPTMPARARTGKSRIAKERRPLRGEIEGRAPSCAATPP